MSSEPKKTRSVPFVVDEHMFEALHHFALSRNQTLPAAVRSCVEFTLACDGWSREGARYKKNVMTGKKPKN
jgi:hypothetical protein